VEGTHGQLGTGLADGLSGDDAYRFPDINGFSGGQVTAVAVLAYPVTTAAGKYRANFYFFNAGGHNYFGVFMFDDLVFSYDNLTGFGMN